MGEQRSRFRSGERRGGSRRRVRQTDRSYIPLRRADTKGASRYCHLRHRARGYRTRGSASALMAPSLSGSRSTPGWDNPSQQGPRRPSGSWPPSPTPSELARCPRSLESASLAAAVRIRSNRGRVLLAKSGASPRGSRRERQLRLTAPAASSRLASRTGVTP